MAGNQKDRRVLTRNELQKKNKDDLIKMILDSDASAASLSPQPQTFSDDDLSRMALALRPIIGDANKDLMDELKELREEVAHLKEQLKSLSPDPSRPNTGSPHHPSLDRAPSFAEVVRRTVKSTFAEEKAHAEVIISGVEEEGRDPAFLSDLCHQLSFDTKPTAALRLGKPKASDKDGVTQNNGTDRRPRLLKVTFPSQFDARAFRARYDEAKKEKAAVPNLRLRPGKSAEERKNYAEKKKLVTKMNKEAQEAGASHSFSLRESGEIWKFQQSDDGNWRRVKEWKEPESPKNE